MMRVVISAKYFARVNVYIISGVRNLHLQQQFATVHVFALACLSGCNNLKTTTWILIFNFTKISQHIPILIKVGWECICFT
jgi:hypothetical protein